MRIIKLLFILLIPTACYSGQFDSDKNASSLMQVHANENFSTTKVLDSGINHNDIESFNGATSASGRFGNAMYFDGNNDWGAFTAQGFSATNRLTVAVSFNIQKVSAGSPQMLLNEGHFQSGFGIDFDGSSTGKKSIFTYLRKASDFVVSADYSSQAEMEKALLDRWHRLVFVMGTNHYTWYLDGVMLGSRAIVTPQLTNSLGGTVVIGALNGVPSSPLKGLMEELIYKQDVAWTKTEVERDWRDWSGRHSNVQEN